MPNASNPVSSARRIPGDPATGLLLIADHASNHVPADVTLDVPPSMLDEHVAVDIGVAPLADALCGALGCPGVLAGVSRLVIDLNREEDSLGLIPTLSDGRAIPGNAALNLAAREERLACFYRPYHRSIADLIRRTRPMLLISLHSFTPCLATSAELRPWEVGVLYNRDERAARIAIPLLEAAGLVVGDNFPYSGRVLNATMNRHGEANGIAYLGLEIRQDLIVDAAGVAHWAEVLAPVVAETARELAPDYGARQ